MANFELLDPTSLIRKSLQRSLDLVAFGLEAAEHVEMPTLEIPGFFHLTADISNAMDMNQVKTEFRSWILGNGLRDCVDAIGPSLEWARKICFIWTREGSITENEDGTISLSARMSGEDWNTHIVHKANQFDFFPLKKKLDHLQNTYGLAKPELSNAILSINSARNCLTHRKGVVGPEDLDKSTSALNVSWRKFEIKVKNDDGSRVIETATRVNKGEYIMFGTVNVCKQFSLGERIDFSHIEFVEITTTFLFFALQIQKAILTMQNSRRSNKDQNQ